MVTIFHYMQILSFFGLAAIFWLGPVEARSWIALGWFSAAVPLTIGAIVRIEQLLRRLKPQ